VPLTLIDFSLFNARRFYSSMGNPLGVKGLRQEMLTHLDPRSWLCLQLPVWSRFTHTCLARAVETLELSRVLEM